MSGFCALSRLVGGPVNELADDRVKVSVKVTSCLTYFLSMTACFYLLPMQQLHRSFKHMLLTTFFVCLCCTASKHILVYVRGEF